MRIFFSFRFVAPLTLSLVLLGVTVQRALSTTSTESRLKVSNSCCKSNSFCDEKQHLLSLCGSDGDKFASYLLYDCPSYCVESGNGAECNSENNGCVTCAACFRFGGCLCKWITEDLKYSFTVGPVIVEECKESEEWDENSQPCRKEDGCPIST